MSVAELESREIQLEAPAGGLWREAWFRLRRNPAAIAGFSLVGAFVVIAIFAPLIAPYDPRQQNLNLVTSGCCPGPSGAHWLGRDELSRLLYGARFSLIIGLVAVSAGLSIGLILGSIAGYLGGFVGSLTMR